MSTTPGGSESSSTAQSDSSRASSGPASDTDDTQMHQQVSDEGAERPKSSTSSMKDVAMARTAQGRDLAARKARALRGATAGLASGSAAGATAGRGQSSSASRDGRDPSRPGDPRTSTPSSTARTSGNRSPSRPAAARRGGPRRVRLTAQRVDPWSVLKISFLVSVALGISGVVMVAVLWTVLSGMNVFSTLNDFLAQITSGETGGPSFDLTDYLGFGRVVALTASLGILNVFLLTALATLSAFLYNICAALVGGAQITLSDE